MKVLVVAGEASGDFHAANLVSEMRSLRPGLSFFGIGGSRMESAGVRLLARTEELSVVGLTEVFSKLPAVRRAMVKLHRETVREKPDVAVLVDYPGFNLRFARVARGTIPKIIYYIGPQVWAWGGWRAKSIPVLFDAMLSIIPFECSYYRGTGLECHFVGHPVLDLVRPASGIEEFRREQCLSGERVVGIVPGSRREEVKRILPVMLDCAAILKERIGKIAFVVAVADTIESGLVESMCDRFYRRAVIVKGKTHELMQASDALLVASGTATLEAAVIGTPMLVIYRTSPLTWLLARGLVKVDSVALVNIIAGRRIVPEFIQFDARPGRIAEEVELLLEETARVREMRTELAAVRERLGSAGASRRAAELVLEISG